MKRLDELMELLRAVELRAVPERLGLNEFHVFG
jgi:hypothetical protein